MIKKKFLILITALFCTLIYANSFGANDFDLNNWIKTCSTLFSEQLTMSNDNSNPGQLEKEIKIEIKKTIKDTQSVYIIYDLIVPSWIDLTNNVQFEKMSLNFNNASMSENVMSSVDEKILDQKQNQRTVLLKYINNTDIKDGQLELELSNLGYYTTDNDKTIFNSLINNSWKLTCDMSNVENEKKIIVDKTASILDKSDSKNKKIHVTNLLISPISLTVEYSKINSDSIKSAWITMNMKDKTKIICGKDTIDKVFFGTKDGGSMYYCFSDSIEISDIESITMGNITVDITI